MVHLAGGVPPVPAAPPPSLRQCAPPCTWPATESTSWAPRMHCNFQFSSAEQADSERNRPADHKPLGLHCWLANDREWPPTQQRRPADVVHGPATLLSEDALVLRLDVHVNEARAAPGGSGQQRFCRIKACRSLSCESQPPMPSSPVCHGRSPAQVHSPRRTATMPALHHCNNPCLAHLLHTGSSSHSSAKPVGSAQKRFQLYCVSASPPGASCRIIIR